MTHEELMNELYEVSAFLLKKADLLEKQCFESRADKDLCHSLHSICKYTGAQRLYDIESGYIKTANEFTYKTGDGVRARMSQEEAK